MKGLFAFCVQVTATAVQKATVINTGVHCLWHDNQVWRKEGFVYHDKDEVDFFYLFLILTMMTVCV